MTREKLQQQAIDQARTEYSDTGLVSLTTAVAIMALGMDAPAIISEIEEEYANHG